MKHSPLTALVLVGAVCAVAGCASAPDRYYTLASADAAPPTAPARVRGLAIEVLPVALPERLAKPQMLVRQRVDGSQVALLEQHRWSSSFENELRDALAAGIAQRAGAIDVSKGARTAADPVWRVLLQVRRFDLVENLKVDTAFVWTLRRSDESGARVCDWNESVAVGPGIDALANGAQLATAHLAAAIANGLQLARTSPDVTAWACPEPAPR